MGEGKKIGVRMAKANEKDMNAAFELAGLLEALERGFYPAREGDENAPMHFDETNREHLEYLHDRLTEIASKGSLFRVVGGLDTLLNPNNAVVDPDDDCIALHPRFKTQPMPAPGAVDEATEALAKKMYDAQKDRLGREWEGQWKPTKDHWIAKARAALTTAGRESVGVDGLGLRDADPFMETHYHRVMTFTAQPNNIEASRFSSAFRAARLGGDSIDHGLSIMLELHAIGYGIVRVPPLDAAKLAEIRGRHTAAGC